MRQARRARILKAQKPSMDDDRISNLNDVEHWRGRADQARALAVQIMDPQTRAAMLQIADGYKTMARHAGARAVKGRKLGPTQQSTQDRLSMGKAVP